MNPRPKYFLVAGLVCLMEIGLMPTVESNEPWPRHTIDDESRGADGIRLTDMNKDGRLDIVTGWEEGGLIRVCFHPGSAAVRENWPAVTVGKVKSPEDAFAVDLDGDGFNDVVSCHEGSEQSVWVHWGPRDPALQSEAAHWTSQPIDATVKQGRWMFGFAMDVDSANGIDLIVGSKVDGTVGWLQSPANPRESAEWKLHRIQPAGWIMSLEPADINGDGQTDILVTDRKGKRRGLYWLEKQTVPRSGNPAGTLENDGPPIAWQRHEIGGADYEVLFAHPVADASGRVTEIWVATRNNKILQFTGSAAGATWRQRTFDNPFGVSCGKAIAIASIDANTRMIAHTSNTAASKLARQQPAVAVAAMHRDGAGQWQLGGWRDVSGTAGLKFDLMEWIDIDGDGDLDLLTCEERDNLGVFWYENTSTDSPLK